MAKWIVGAVDGQGETLYLSRGAWSPARDEAVEHSSRKEARSACEEALTANTAGCRAFPELFIEKGPMQGTPKVYVASALGNYQKVIRLQHALRRAGATIHHDWASRWRDRLVSGKQETPEEEREELLAEIQAVRDCHVLLLVMPGKRGAHVEFGAALGLGKRVVVLCEEEGEEIGFHRIPPVRLVRDEQSALQEVMRVLP